MAIKIFFHICAITRAETVVKNMIRSIHFSGLYDEVDKIYCYLSGDINIIKNIYEIIMTSGAKFCIMKCQPNDTSYERLTLEDIHNHVDKFDKILYIHSKGVSQYHQEDIARIKCIDDWCDVMLYYLVRHYRICIEKLEVHDTVGIIFKKLGTHNEILPHWSGNFWWVRGDYFLSLPTNIGPCYYEPEQMFLFVNNPRIYELHSVPNINFYYERYEPYKYVDNRIDNNQN